MTPGFNITTARIGRAIILFVVSLGLAACAGNHEGLRTQSSSRPPTLDRWLDNTLIPYLVQQFEQHPRFRSQPLLLVRMQAENVSPQIDELTEGIRQKITDAMLKRPGLDLAWRPSPRNWKYYQRLGDIACGEDRRVHYYIGIDCTLRRAGRQLEVKVRALNLIENKWVSGFGRSWQGAPTRDQIDALGRVHVDEYLRGQRPLPFSSQQPDMLAAYLARNLSCRLRHGQSDSLIVYVRRPAANTPKSFRTTLDIIGRYLARFKEVEVTDDPSQANVTLVAAIHAIDDNLHQVWVSARRQPGDIYLPGAGTEAYVSFDGKEHNPVETAGIEAATAVSLPSRPVADDPGPLPIILSFDLLAPPGQQQCAQNMNWQTGAAGVDPNQTLKTGSCVALEVRTSVPSYIFLLGQDAGGELSRLHPSDCFSTGRLTAQYHPGGHMRFPGRSNPGVLKIDGPPGVERLYAVAITAPGLAGRFVDQIEDLPGPCRPGDGFPGSLRSDNLRHPHERIDRWRNFLGWLSENHPGLMDWRQIRFRHGDMVRGEEPRGQRRGLRAENRTEGPGMRTEGRELRAEE